MKTLLTLLVFAGLAYGQPVGIDSKVLQSKEPPIVKDQTPVTKDDTPKVEPAAILVGPTDPITPNTYVRVKITGTIGDDPKLLVVPAVKNMDLVTFADGSYGITAQLTEVGNYTFFLGVNKGSKTAVTTLTLTVAPPPVPDPTVIKLKEAFLEDGSPHDAKAKLVSLYRQMAKEKVATWKDLAGLLSTTSKGMFSETELVATRKVVTELLTQTLGAKDGPVNVSIQLQVFNSLADAIANVN